MGDTGIFVKRAHPRSRGENLPRLANIPHFLGSSPLTRGKLLPFRSIGLLVGLIPAHAGKTVVLKVVHAALWAHPRSRGENGIAAVRPAVRPGSSPLTRGKRGVDCCDDARIGLIPAHAGKTSRRRCRPWRAGAHPRSRGENIKSAVGSVIDWGSSPLTRGKPPARSRKPSKTRLIPAHAGKTVSLTALTASRTAHPRSRGEN